MVVMPEFDMPPGWEELGRRESIIAWLKIIDGNTLRVEYSKDEVTEEFKTEGLLLSIFPVKHWVIKDGRKYLWDLQARDGDLRHVNGDLVDTDHGAGEVIDGDVSTPPKMAVYLEVLAKG